MCAYACDHEVEKLHVIHMDIASHCMLHVFKLWMVSMKYPLS